MFKLGLVEIMILLGALSIGVFSILAVIALSKRKQAKLAEDRDNS